MKPTKRILIIGNIKLPLDASFKEAFSVAQRRLKSLCALPSDVSYSIHKRSVDARRKDAVIFVYSVLCEGSFPEISEDRLRGISALWLKEERPTVEFGSDKLSDRPVVVGTGPCGLFCALLLAENGYRPLMLERGGDIASRSRAVTEFNSRKILDTENNIQFGLGGAGTFSDGKLITRINDPYIGFLLDTFVEFGAPADIRVNAKPHIGTDILAKVVTAMAERITSLGGEIRYNTKFLSAQSCDGRVYGVRTDKGDIPAGALVLAVGHSARDTYESLISSGIEIIPKSFSVGMRIEHLAKEIDEAMYGKFAGHPALGHAEYALSHNTKQRGTYTFCMCPGGEVVAAASEKYGVVVNGMSNSKRDGVNSNSAVVVSVFPDDYGSTPKSAIEFQRKIERGAYGSAGSDYSAPIVTVGDFMARSLSHEPSRVMPTYMQGSANKICMPDEYLPGFVCDGIRSALVDFDRKIKGFSADYAILSGAETRTSSPVRILRDNATRLAVGYENFYPAGEGAGYAGGISSAGVDGIKVALSLMKKYKPIEH